MTDVNELEESLREDIRALFAERDALRAENEQLRNQLKQFADPDNWEHVDEAHWIWDGFPPFESAAIALLGDTKLGSDYQPRTHDH